MDYNEDLDSEGEYYSLFNSWESTDNWREWAKNFNNDVPYTDIQKQLVYIDVCNALDDEWEDYDYDVEAYVEDCLQDDLITMFPLLEINRGLAAETIYEKWDGSNWLSTQDGKQWLSNQKN